MEDNVAKLEYQYSPSRWSKRCGADEIIKRHVEFATKESENNKNEIQCELNVAYGNSLGEKYDIFGTDLPKEAPILIYVHGGFWQELSRNISSYLVKPFHKNGIKVIILGYDLCPNVTLPELIKEIRKGFDKCLEYAVTNKSVGVSLAGHSAGAHLVSSLFMNISEHIEQHERIVKTVFLFSGIYNLVPLVGTYINIPLKLDSEAAMKLSPLQHGIAWGENVKFFVLVGEYESSEFHKQSKLYHEKLKKLEYETRLVVVDGVDHFDIVERLSEQSFLITSLMLQEIRGPFNPQ
ncbi:kynurenine formamidase isoform X2 [Agrilus planipennis]|uniref:Kynurenine formamidase isoform X2 n=1 Tax=Agrilus planipennis TaxID=224129 RepID=A0A1W4XRI6_AGRPL|nr:kynurenine formamidase isoform X2 [Agrilus planipennis]